MVEPAQSPITPALIPKSFCPSVTVNGAVFPVDGSASLFLNGSVPFPLGEKLLPVPMDDFINSTIYVPGITLSKTYFPFASEVTVAISVVPFSAYNLTITFGTPAVSVAC